MIFPHLVLKEDGYKQTVSTGESNEFTDLIICTTKRLKMKPYPGELMSHYELMSNKQYRPGEKNPRTLHLIMTFPIISF